jgi:hypothetical protein
MKNSFRKKLICFLILILFINNLDRVKSDEII